MLPFFRFTRSVTPADVYAAGTVLVPLEEAHRYSHSRRQRLAQVAREDSKDPATDEEADELEGLVGGDEWDDEEESVAKQDAVDKNGANGGVTLRTAPPDRDSYDGHPRTETTVLNRDRREDGSTTEYTIEGLRREARRGEKAHWTDYELKSKIVNKAIQDIGMGRYNWQLFVLCGFGWFADNLWLQGVSLTLPSLSAEFGIAEKTVRYTTSSLFLGLCVGSFFWGLGSDIMGRRIAFNCTLLITSVFGMASGFAGSWGAVCAYYAALGFGVGGNLPVDGALFLEFLPDASSSLLTLLSIWWPIGQLASSLFAWFFMANWPPERGWRLFVITIGVVTFVMFFVRFFVFHLFESPKYLLSRGRQAEAVAVVHGIAHRNGSKTWLTEDILDAVAADNAVRPVLSRRLSTTNILRDRLSSFSADRLRPLFKSRKLGVTTALIWFCWATIGLGYPLFNAFLPQYLSHGGTGGSGPSPSPPPGQDGAAAAPISAETYRNYAITSVVGVPGSLLAAYTVDHQSPFLGRRGTLAISTLVSAVFLFSFASMGTSAASQLAFSCIEAFAQNIMYGVLYAFTPEIFPAPVRGAGTGVASFLNRVTGLAAPLLAANVPGDGTTTPIYMSAALILAAFVGMCLIPIETRGKQRL